MTNQPDPPRSIQDCHWFGFPGTVTAAQLRTCSCTRCLSELNQLAFLRDLGQSRP